MRCGFGGHAPPVHARGYAIGAHERRKRAGEADHVCNVQPTSNNCKCGSDCDEVEAKHRAPAGVGPVVDEGGEELGADCVDEHRVDGHTLHHHSDPGHQQGHRQGRGLPDAQERVSACGRLERRGVSERRAQVGRDSDTDVGGGDERVGDAEVARVVFGPGGRPEDGDGDRVDKKGERKRAENGDLGSGEARGG
eukprot:scaffold34_cov124-Isochrysis_galbana.AAC.13